MADPAGPPTIPTPWSADLDRQLPTLEEAIQIATDLGLYPGAKCRACGATETAMVAGLCLACDLSPMLAEAT